MNLKKVTEYFEQEFNGKDIGMILLHATRSMIELAATEDAKKETGTMVIDLARILEKVQTPDQLLLDFFSVTREEVLESVGSEFLQSQGLYRSLVNSPQLSLMCELFLDSWALAACEENPYICQIRRVGADAFRIVTKSPGGCEEEYPEDLTLEEVAEGSNWPRKELREMPVLQ